MKKDSENIERIANNSEKNFKWSLMENLKRDHLNLDLDRRFLEINFDFPDITEKESHLFANKQNQLQAIP